MKKKIWPKEEKEKFDQIESFLSDFHVDMLKAMGNVYANYGDRSILDKTRAWHIFTKRATPSSLEEFKSNLKKVIKEHKKNLDKIQEIVNGQCEP